MPNTAFIYSVNNARVGIYLRATYERKMVPISLPSKLGVEVKGAGVKATLVGGKGDGEEVEQIGPNQRAIVRIGTLSPDKYQAKVVVCPELFKSATVHSVDIVEPGETAEVVLYISAFKTLDLTSLPWLVRLYSFN